MKIFIELRKFYKILGIEPFQNHHLKNVLLLLLLLCYSGATAAYIFFEEITYIDFGNSWYSTTCMVVNFIGLSTSIIRKSKIFDLINKLERTIESSKLIFIKLIKINSIIKHFFFRIKPEFRQL